MSNVMSLVILIAIAALLVSAISVRRINNRCLRWGVMGLAGLLAIINCSLAVVAAAGMYRMHARTAPVPYIKIAGTPAQIQRGEAIVNSFCGSCHSRTGHLTGGMDLGKDLSIPVGSFVSANLTPAGRLGRWSDGEVFRAIRNGIDADGHWLTIMSYTNASKLSDDDTRSVIAYLRTQPMAGTATASPPDELNMLGLVLLGAGVLPGGNPVVTGVVTAPPKGPSIQFGEYISRYQDCRQCHGANLAGGKPGQLAPIGPNLVLLKAWKLEEFIATMRTGINPGGAHLSEQMPWRPIGKMDDEELTALYAYLTHLTCLGSAQWSP